MLAPALRAALLAAPRSQHSRPTLAEGLEAAPNAEWEKQQHSPPSVAFPNNTMGPECSKRLET